MPELPEMPDRPGGKMAQHYTGASGPVQSDKNPVKPRVSRDFMAYWLRTFRIS